jgi:hypothetical protein
MRVLDRWRPFLGVVMAIERQEERVLNVSRLPIGEHVNVTLREGRSRNPTASGLITTCTEHSGRDRGQNPQSIPSTILEESLASRLARTESIKHNIPHRTGERELSA